MITRKSPALTSKNLLSNGDVTNPQTKVQMSFIPGGLWNTNPMVRGPGGCDAGIYMVNGFTVEAGTKWFGHSHKRGRDIFVLTTKGCEVRSCKRRDSEIAHGWTVCSIGFHPPVCLDKCQRCVLGSKLAISPLLLPKAGSSVAGLSHTLFSYTCWLRTFCSYLTRLRSPCQDKN